MTSLKVGYAPQAKLSWLNDGLETTRQQSVAALEALGVELVAAEKVLTGEPETEELAAEFRRQDVDVIVIHYLTFSLGSLTPLLAQRVGVPVILWGMPEPPFDGGRIKSNSFCACNMNSHTLRKLQHPYSFVFGMPADIAADMSQQFRVVACMKRLRNTRIGMVGSRVPGFYTSNFNELELRRNFGVEVKYIDLLEIVEAAKNLSAEELAAAEADIREHQVSSCGELPADQLEKCVQLYGGFLQVKEKANVDGFAVKCWPQFGDIFGIGVCAILGFLTNRGLVASCEGDMYGAVAMVILEELTGKAPFYCDLIAFEEENNVGLGWHCGAAPSSLCASGCSSQLGFHSVMDGGGVKGVTSDFPLKPGPVTFTQLGEDIDGSYRFLIARGEGLETKQMLPGNPLRIRFDAPLKDLTKTIIDGGYSHHYTVGYADLTAELKQLCSWLGVAAVEVD